MILVAIQLHLSHEVVTAQSLDSLKSTHKKTCYHEALRQSADYYFYQHLKGFSYLTDTEEMVLDRLILQLTCPKPSD